MKKTVAKPEPHPNRIPFVGVLTRLDTPSNKAVSGSQGRLVLITTDAARAALGTLIGMGVSFRESWDGHDRRRKCGIITRAYISGNKLCVRGHLYGHDFPEVVVMMQRKDVELGMSYEMSEASAEDKNAPGLLRLKKVMFTGAAILFRDKAAYTSTRIGLLNASADVFNGRLVFGGGTVKLLKSKNAPAARSSAHH